MKVHETEEQVLVHVAIFKRHIFHLSNLNQTLRSFFAYKSLKYLLDTAISKLKLDKKKFSCYTLEAKVRSLLRILTNFLENLGEEYLRARDGNVS
jgi:hypothetical protein